MVCYSLKKIASVEVSSFLDFSTCYAAKTIRLTPLRFCTSWYRIQIYGHRLIVKENKHSRMLLFVVFFEFIIHYCKLYFSLLKHFNSICVSMISFFADDPFDSSVNYHHCTGSARRHLAEKGRSFKWYAKPCSLKDCVLFRMESANAMLGYFAVTV